MLIFTTQLKILPMPYLMSINKAIGDKKGIKRYGFFYITMDESLSRTVIDFSGRPELVWKVELGLRKLEKWIQSF